MISVIIPAFNEEKTIYDVVRYVASCDRVTEAIVVDDKSVDNTVARASQAGATIITSEKLGKGTSMKEGLHCSKNNIIVFLDGDIHPYPQQTIDLLTRPILEDRADFVKASFTRNAGRVTELLAKPLMNIFFPEIAHFEQPLSGMIAGKKSFFEKVDFCEDYGVDIGILIDMHIQKARIREVRIGHIKNKSKTWQALGKMSKEVAVAIISRAEQQKREYLKLGAIQPFSEIRNQMEFAIKELRRLH
jgi:glycosyltransferase involved in cell wall biosynthesis